MAQREPEEAPLKFQLDAITNHTRALVPTERLRSTEELIKTLLSSGQQERILPVGASAPTFHLQAASGKWTRSADLLSLGPVVLKFFRGRWDPYDMTELEAWERLQLQLRAQRALLVGISPQTMRQNAFTAEHHRLTFPLLADVGCAVAESFGLAYTLPPAGQAHFRSILINLPLMNGDNHWRLPLPATYVLHPDGTVLYAQASADHRLRPEPQEALAALPLARRGSESSLPRAH